MVNAIRSALGRFVCAGQCGKAALWIVLATCAFFAASMASADLQGCVNGCDGLCCIWNATNGQCWHYHDGTCYYTYISTTADPKKMPTAFTTSLQKYKANNTDRCPGTTGWVEASGCVEYGDPTTDTTCRTDCVDIPSGP